MLVDNTTIYKWLGTSTTPGDLNDTVLTNIQITPTQTILSIVAGPIDLIVTWLSPIEVFCLTISLWFPLIVGPSRPIPSSSHSLSRIYPSKRRRTTANPTLFKSTSIPWAVRQHLVPST